MLEAAIVSWLVAGLGSATTKAGRHLLFGAPEKRALRSIVRSAVREVVAGIVGLDPAQRKSAYWALREGIVGPERFRRRLRRLLGRATALRRQSSANASSQAGITTLVTSEAELRTALASWTELLDRPAAPGVNGYLTGLGLSSGQLADRLAEAILAGIRANARSRGPLEPLATWLWRDEVLALLKEPRSSSDSVVPEVSVWPPFGRRDLRHPLHGRDALVGELIRISLAQSDTQTRVWVLCGLSGSGKTALALEVASRVREHGAPVWWVEATDRATLEAGMHAVARQIDVPHERLQFGDAPDVLWERIIAHTTPWLLVIDNANDSNLLATGDSPLGDGRGWLRPLRSHAGLVLVTSQDASAASWASWCRLEPVGMLDQGAAVRVLLDYTSGAAGGAADAALLAGRLGGLPKALQLAGLLLAETTSTPWRVYPITTFVAYVAALDDQDDRYSEWRAPDSEGDARQIIKRTWELSRRLLYHRDEPYAEPLLRLLSSLADAPVPYKLLLEPTVIGRQAEFAGIDGNRLWSCLRKLAELGLIDLDVPYETAPSLAMLRVHPLVRTTSQQQPAPGGHLATRDTTVALVASAAAVLGDDPEQPRSWQRWQALVPLVSHQLRAIKCQDHPENTLVMSILHPADRVIRYLVSRGQYYAAEEECRALLELLGKTFGEDDFDTLTIRHNLADILRAQGRFREAKDEFQAVLAASQRTLSDDHPHTLASQHNLAGVLHDLGDLRHAEKEFRTVLAARRERLGDDHPSTFRTRHNLTNVFLDQHRYDVAVAELTVLLSALGRASENNERMMLAVRHNIARAHYGKIQLPQAEAEFQAVHAARVSLLGGDHPDTLASRHFLARIKHDYGDFVNAEAEMGAIIEILQPLLGAQHPNTLTVRHDRARVLRDQGKEEQADDEFRRVLNIRIRLLGSEHPLALDSRLAVAKMMYRRGESLVARSEAQDVLTSLRRVFGDKHPHVAAVESGLASLLEKA